MTLFTCHEEYYLAFERSSLLSSVTLEGGFQVSIQVILDFFNRKLVLQTRGVCGQL